MSKKLLFTSRNCNACPVMKRKLRKAKIPFREISVDNKKGDELADKLGVKLLPQMAENRNGKLVLIKDTDDWFE